MSGDGTEAPTPIRLLSAPGLVPPALAGIMVLAASRIVRRGAPRATSRFIEPVEPTRAGRPLVRRPRSPRSSRPGTVA
jgi:hypothetical protein